MRGAAAPTRWKSSLSPYFIPLRFDLRGTSHDSHLIGWCIGVGIPPCHAGRSTTIISQTWRHPGHPDDRGKGANIMDPDAPNFGDTPSRSTILNAALQIGLLGLLVYACSRIILPFTSILLWSAILAVMLYPLHLRL